jgi:hypothetical protein
MMMKTKSIIPAFVALVVAMSILSCKSEQVKRDLARVDSIATVIDQAEEKLQSVHMDSLRMRFGLYKEYAGEIETHFEELKTEESFPYFCSYRNCKKSFDLMISGYPDFREDIDSARIQLENLKHDIRKEMLEPDEINQFILLETQNARLLLEKISFRVDNAVKEEINFDTVHPRIVKFVEDYKNKNTIVN